MTAILGTFVSIKTMADGSPRIVLDMQCTLSEVAAMGLIPGTPFALARLTKEAAGKPVVEPVSQPEAPKEKPGPLCVMACNFCADLVFWEWISRGGGYANDEQDAKRFILYTCEIDSRKKLDQSERAAQLFHALVRKPFMAWRDAR